MISSVASSTLFTLASVVGAVGTGISALSAYQSSKAQAAAESMNARIAIQNAELEADRSRRNAMRERASATASFGASGILVNSGSNLSVLQDMAAQQAENELNILYGGQVNSANARNRSTAYSSQATGSLIGGAAKAGAGLLGDAYTYSRRF